MNLVADEKDGEKFVNFVRRVLMNFASWTLLNEHSADISIQSLIDAINSEEV